MNIKITRHIQSNKYYYRFDKPNTPLGYTNFFYNLLLKKITVCFEKNIIEMKQTNWLLKIFNSLPILNIETFTPYKYYNNGVCCGYSKKYILKPIFAFFIDEDYYEVKQCSDNSILLTRNKAKIALYKKEDWSTLEENTYNLKIINESNIDTKLLLLFCIFIDVEFYPNNWKLSYFKYEKNHIIKTQG